MSGFTHSVADEFALTLRALKKRDNQILLGTTFVVGFCLCWIVVAVSRYDSFMEWLFPNQCRDLSNSQIMLFTYFVPAFFVSGATFIGSVVHFLKEREFERSTRRQFKTDPLRQMQLHGLVFGLITIVVAVSSSQWC